MIATIRALAKSWVSVALIGLLIVSFAIFNVRDVFKGQSANQVVVAGNRSIGPQAFKSEWERARKGLEQQAGRPVSTELAVENHFDTRLVNELAMRESLGALLDKVGLKPSDALMKARIEKIPNFFDRVSGRFDKTLYLQTLAQNDLTAPKFEQGMRDEIAESHLASGLVDGLRVPRAYSALAAVFATENRTINYFAIDPRTVPPLALPTDAQLTKFMQENAAQLMRPEYRILTVVRFSPAQVAPSVAVTEAEVEKQFNFRKDTLNRPEMRSLVQIAAKDAVAAQAIAARLTKGEAPEAVAKSVGVEAVVYDSKPRTAIVDPKISAAAFAMAKDGVQVVKGDLGYAAIKLTGITPGHTTTLAEVRPMLEAEARKTAAAERVYELSQKYDDAHAGGASLVESAAKAGVPTMTLGPVSEQGADPEGKSVGSITQKLVQVAFALPQGGESEIEDEGAGESFAVRVERVIPKAVPPLAEVKPQLTRVWMSREMAKRLQAKADELTARIKKGESLEAVAASVGSKPVQSGAINRQSAQQDKSLSQDALGKVFNSAPGDVFSAENAQSFGLIIAKLGDITVPSATDLARPTEDSRPQLTMAVFREIGEDMRVSARRTMKAKTDMAVARAALGLAPLETKSAKSTVKGPEKAK